jgi:SAM-dependent methyltransferase
MVPGLLARAGLEGSYVGFDVYPHALRWCQKHYGSDPRCRFELARVASPYGTWRGTRLERFKFPLEDGAADLVLAKSVFTHLVADEARRYLEETRRVLRPGRAALITAFLFEKGSRTAQGSSRAFPHTEATGRMRWRSRLMPESGIAYEKLYFAELVEGAGLHVQWLCPGFLPGDGDDPAGQDILLLGH